jgi:acetoin utilization deacetylase AcuC-like enzyme
VSELVVIAPRGQPCAGGARRRADSEGTAERGERQAQSEPVGASALPWILDARGRRTPAHDDAKRLTEVHAGLSRHERVRAAGCDVSGVDVERTLRKLHDASYLDALDSARHGEPVLVAELAQPGLEPDTPVCAEAVAAARESAAVAIAAARRVLAGARFSYALCRPPGHHAGPEWLGGYCYLNNAAAAALTLREGGVGRVAILDLDIHYPNGTSALLARMRDTSLHSLHGATGANLPWHRVRARSEREHLVRFRRPPAPGTYLLALAATLGALAPSADAVVLSLGYDTVAGDPHGGWSVRAPTIAKIGALVRGTGLPLCIVQEGGYALGTLADCSRAFAHGLLDRSCS